MELDQEQRDTLFCTNPTCKASLFDAGLDLVDSSVTVTTHHRLYNDGLSEMVQNDNDANDDNETRFCCGICGFVVSEEARELIEEIFDL